MSEEPHQERAGQPAGRPVDPWLIEHLLAGELTATDAGQEGIVGLFGALRAPAAPQELAGEQGYREAFVTLQALRTAPPHPVDGPPHRSPRRSVLVAKVAVAAAVLATVSGAAAAAYTGSLPVGLQRVAHDTLGAPAPDHSVTPGPVTASPRATGTTSSPSAGTAGPSRGPTATGAAAYGLCNAYSRGGLATTSTAYASLVAAAGGTDQITSYCAAIAHPGKATATGAPTPVRHGTGKPTTVPSRHGTGKPTTHPTGKPSTTRSPHGTGKPTTTATG